MNYHISERGLCKSMSVLAVLSECMSHAWSSPAVEILGTGTSSCSPNQSPQCRVQSRYPVPATCAPPFTCWLLTADCCWSYRILKYFEFRARLSSDQPSTVRCCQSVLPGQCNVVRDFYTVYLVYLVLDISIVLDRAAADNVSTELWCCRV